MQWFQAAKKLVTADDPFGFQTVAPSPGPVGPPKGGPRPPGGPSWPSVETDKRVEKFEDKDQHMRRIMKMLGGMDAGRLATLADALGQGDAFWSNLSVSPAAETAAPEPAAEMPAQTQVEAPKGPMDRRLTPGQQNIQDYLQQHQVPPAQPISQPASQPDPTSYQERLRANRPPGPPMPVMPKKKPGAHFD